MNIALILAGGSGVRMNREIPKQFVRVNDIPIIVYSMKVFQESEKINAICVVSHPDWIDSVWDYSHHFGITKTQWVVSGGRTGLESVKNGIESLTKQEESDIVLIHDSVRPFLTHREIDDNVKVASIHGVAVTSVPCVETLIKVDAEKKSEQLIPRDGLMRVMTPQSFRLAILRDLYNNTDVNDYYSYPSTFALYMSKGFPVYCSYGSERNVKLTYPEDIELFNNIF